MKSKQKVFVTTVYIPAPEDRRALAEVIQRITRGSPTGVFTAHVGQGAVFGVEVTEENKTFLLQK